VTQLAGLQYNPQLSWRISINIYYPAFMIYEKLQKTKYFLAILSQFILAVAT